MENPKQKSLIALKKAKTSIEKVIEMIEKDENCDKIVTQNLAIIWLIKSSNLKLLETFIEKCDLKNIEEKQEKIIQIFKLLQK